MRIFYVGQLDPLLQDGIRRALEGEGLTPEEVDGAMDSRVDDLEDTFGPLPDTGFYRTMSRGHSLQKGHPLRGFLVPSKEPGISLMVRSCCFDD